MTPTTLLELAADRAADALRAVAGHAHLGDGHAARRQLALAADRLRAAELAARGAHLAPPEQLALPWRAGLAGVFLGAVPDALEAAAIDDDDADEHDLGYYFGGLRGVDEVRLAREAGRRARLDLAVVLPEVALAIAQAGLDSVEEVRSLRIEARRG